MSLDTICFDFDSTLTKIEGIDELARRVFVNDTLAELTNLAMNGEICLETIYGKRLALIKPNRVAVKWLSDLYIEQLVDGVIETIQMLFAHGKSIHIVSGGLLPAILPLAAFLGIPKSNVHAVDIYFDEKGEYLNYDSTSPLTKNGGKAVIIEALHAKNLVMVGDGKTDLEVQQAGIKIIGFGGVVNRKLVRENADFFVADKNLTAILPYIIQFQ